ncbi:MAG: hypothetical protein EXX96DRAFT_477834 [Benjaminiella poitrasii]|nr:MAG: hypothetical protein EXX96DRAFT_477834 [Benjaminiella poitrasii]
MIDHSTTTNFLQALQEAEPGKYLYQLRCSLPESFYSDIIHNTTSYRIKTFIPDFLYVREDPISKIRKLFIIDAKSSPKMSISHQFQVTSYAFFLSYLIKDIRNLEMDSWGGVWLPSDLDQPQKFQIDFAMSKIKYVYMDMLVNITTVTDPTWVLNKKCDSCPFLNRCTLDAKGTVRSIPYINEEKVKQLREDKTVDMEDLGNLMGGLKIDNSQEASTAQERQLTGYEDYVKAYRDKKPRFLGHASVLTSKETDHVIYIYIQNDLYRQRPFVYGIKAVNRLGEKEIEAFFATDYNDHLQNELQVYSQFAVSFVNALTNVLNYMDQHQSKCLFYVYSGEEKETIQIFLYNLVNTQGDQLNGLDKSVKDQIIADAMRCLVSLFRGTFLLKLPCTIQFPEMDDLMSTSSVARFVSIESLLQENIALGVSNYYRLSDVIEWMTNLNHVENLTSKENDVIKFIGTDVNFMYSSWKKITTNFPIEKMIEIRFMWLQQIMTTFWHLANEYMTDTSTDLFPLTCKQFNWPKVESYNHSHLAKLTYFKQLECIKDCDQVRIDRIRDLSRLEYSLVDDQKCLGGLVLEFCEQHRLNQFRTLLTFTVSKFLNGPQVQQKLDRLVTDNFCQYILVPDTREGIAEAIKFPDLYYMNKNLHYCKTSINGVDIKNISYDRIVLCGKSIKDMRKRWRLYRRYVDYTTMYAINGLKTIDKEEEMDHVIDLIDDPNSWSEINEQDEIKIKNNKMTATLLDEYSMSPSQKDISVNILTKRLQIIWGPPGSGKTEFLALFINWYIKCFAQENENKSLMIGITAFTHDAILNLLKRIEKIQKRHGLEKLFSIIYVTKMKEPEVGSNMIYTDWKSSITVKNSLQKSTSVQIYVIGATTWAWGNIRTNWARFEKLDLLIMDESTQLLVSDALLSIACLKNPSGKLIVAGDHMQLGPIIKNDYTKVMLNMNKPLLYGSIQQCLMRTEDNYAIPAREFFLQKDALHGFGPNTLQLNDNWRMNGKLNNFFQQIYGPKYISRYPDSQIKLDWKHSGLTTKELDTMKTVLDLSQPISLVKLKSEHHTDNMVEKEAKLVELLAKAYLTSKSKVSCSMNQEESRPSLMIATPLHQQRVAIQRKIDSLSQASTVLVNTVEKLQGQECDLVIACFSCINTKYWNQEFLRDFRRWNVALSRAR